MTELAYDITQRGSPLCSVWVVGNQWTFESSVVGGKAANTMMGSDSPLPR